MLLLTCVIIAILFYFGIIPAIDFAVVQNKDPELLKTELKKYLDSIEYKDQLFDNVMMTTWDLKKRKAYVVTKSNMIDDKMPFKTNLEVALASGANPKYFKPVVMGDAAFIGGDAVALSPAMLAFMQATDVENNDANAIRVFSAGSFYERADRIPANVGLAEWSTRINSLTGLSKKQTHDYLLNKILQSDNTFLMKYQYPISSIDRQSIDDMSEPFKDLEHFANDFINENMQQLEEDIRSLVTERMRTKDILKCNL